jgi:hypothetical protein
VTGAEVLEQAARDAEAAGVGPWAAGAAWGVPVLSSSALGLGYLGNDPCYRPELSDHREVTSPDTGGLRLRPLSDERQLGRRNRPVIGTSDRPERDDEPRWGTGGGSEGIEGEWTLNRSEHRGLLGRNEGGEVRVEPGGVSARGDLQVEVVVACR